MSNSGDLRTQRTRLTNQVNNQANADQATETATRVQTSKADLRFIAFCRDLGWGKIELLVKNGKPTMATIVRQDFRFDV